jgi:hypothetical protein
MAGACTLCTSCAQGASSNGCAQRQQHDTVWRIRTAGPQWPEEGIVGVLAETLSRVLALFGGPFAAATPQKVFVAVQQPLTEDQAGARGSAQPGFVIANRD